MDIKDIIGIADNIVTILAIIGGGWLAIFVFLQFAPVLALRISHTWSVDDANWVVLRLEVENKSKIRVHKQAIYFQLLEHKVTENCSLSEWVAFEEDGVIPSERPINWHQPVEIFETTRGIDPGEMLVAERLHYCPPNCILHVGLQVRAKLGLFGRIATRIRGWNQSWTTTRIVMK
jgi:hypothetical protein